MKKEKLKGRAGKKAWVFKSRLEKRKRSMLARMKERFKNGKAISTWEKERRKCYEIRELDMEEVVKGKEEEQGQIWRKDKELQKKEKEEKIKRLRYNKWYGKVMGKGKKILS